MKISVTNETWKSDSVISQDTNPYPLTGFKFRPLLPDINGASIANVNGAIQLLRLRGY